MFKKVLAFTLAAALTLSLTGCCCVTLPEGMLLTESLEGASVESSQVVVPNFVGMNISEISETPEYMENFIFDTQNQQEQYSDKPSGTVLEQSLEPGLLVKKGTKTIVLTVSKGPKMQQIPDVVGMSYTDAQALLVNSGFKVGVRYSVSATTPANCVIMVEPAQYPYEIEYGSEVTLVISIGM